MNMGLTKAEIFNDKQNRLASMMKALAHPARIAIIQQLIKSQACICGDLVDELGLAQATISQHLKELKSVGLIKGTVEGTSVCYCIDGKVWKQYKAAIDSFFVTYINKDECCLFFLTSFIAGNDCFIAQVLLYLLKNLLRTKEIVVNPEMVVANISYNEKTPLCLR